MQTARMGLVVPKRIVRKAVERNRIKRVLREEFRHRLDTLPALDFVLQVVAQVDNSILRSDADALFERMTAGTGDKT